MAKKNTYYFTHDIGARSDEKILAVRMKYGCEGYGVYFMIIEMLAGSADYMCVKDYNVVAFDLRCGADIVKHIIEDFDLFTFTDDGRFYSKSLIERMEPIDNLREQRSNAGRKSAEKRSKSTTAERSLNNPATVVVQKFNNEKERKEKERKEEKENVAAATPGARAHEEQTDPRGIRLGILQEVYAQHFFQKKGVQLSHDPATCTDDLSQILINIEQAMTQAGYVAQDNETLRAFFSDFLEHAYEGADDWQRSNWCLRVVRKQFDRIYQNAKNHASRKQNNGTGAKANRATYSEDFLRRVADKLA